MKVKWLRKALHHLDQEAEFIAKEDSQAARHQNRSNHKHLIR
jgi:plasmid stabilization system protein ParE